MLEYVHQHHAWTTVEHTDLPRLRSVVQTPALMLETWWLFTNDWQFTVQNLDQLYVLVSSAK